MIYAFFYLALLSSLLQLQAAITVNALSNDQLQPDLDLASGSILSMPAGRFNVTGPLAVHSGTTIKGAPNFGTVINLNLSGQSLYGFAVDGNASNVTISGLDIHSSNGVLKMMDGNGYKAIHFIGNKVQYGGGSVNGTNVYCIGATIGCNDLEIEWNYFHDSPNSNRNWEVWIDKNSHLDHNLFYNINDGGHFEEPTLNNTFSWNYGTNIHRMGQEIQGSGQNESGLTCDHDVFYDFVNAYNDSEGMSVCPNYTTGVVVSNGYFRNSLAAGSTFGTMTGGAVGGPNRFGYALEAIAPGILFQNNTIILSSLSADAIASGENTTVNNCAVYGGNNALWGVWGPDFGPTGQKGTFNLGSGALANVVAATTDGAPAPPPNTFAGPDVYAATANGTLWTPSWTPAAITTTPTTNTTPPTTAAAFKITATVMGDSTATVAWTTAPAGNVTLSTISTVGRQIGAVVGPTGVVATTSPVALTGLHPGWLIDVVATASDGGTSTATVQMTGNSTIAWPPAPSKVIIKVVTTMETDYINGVAGTQVRTTTTTYADGSTSTQ